MHNAVSSGTTHESSNDIQYEPWSQHRKQITNLFIVSFHCLRVQLSTQYYIVYDLQDHAKPIEYSLLSQYKSALLCSAIVAQIK